MRETFSFRKMIMVTAFAAAAVSLMAPAYADETTEPFIRDSQVGQSSAPGDVDRTTDGWLLRDSQIGQVPGPVSDVDRTTDGWLLRDSQIGQVPGPVSDADPAPAVGLGDSGTDWVLLSGGLLLAFLMGVAGTLTVQYYRDMRHSTA
jgi:hypothetical protein